MRFPFRIPSGSRRFWIVVLAFAAANAAAWWFTWWHLASSSTRLRVVEFLPGNEAVIDGRTPLMWRFSRDVERGDPAVAPPATISPAISGRWRWQDARTLLFMPDGRLPKASRIRISLLPQRLRSCEGGTMRAAYEVAVRTAPLRVVSVGQGGFEDNNRFIIRLQFNDHVLPADVAAKLTLTGPDGRPVHFAMHGDGADEVLRVITEPVPAGDDGQTQVTVKLAAGLRGLSGPLGLEADFEQAIPLNASLSVASYSALAPARGKPAIRLTFNGHTSAEILRKVVSVSPAVPFAIEAEYWRRWSIVGDFVPGTRYTVNLGRAPAGTDARLCPRPESFSVAIPDRASGVWFHEADGYLAARGGRTVRACAVNVDSVRLNIYRLYDNNIVAWRNNDEDDRSDTSKLDQPLASRTISIPRQLNRQHDILIALDEMLPAGAARDGVYRLELLAEGTHSGRREHGFPDGEHDAYGEKLRASAIVTLSDIGLTAKRARSGVMVWATSLSTAKPLGNIRVAVYSNKNQLLGEGLTGDDGLAHLRLAPLPDGERPAVVLAGGPANVEAPAHAADHAATQPASRPSAMADARGSALTWLDLERSAWDTGDLHIAGRPYLRDGYEAFIYTDRGVYRPGDTVHLRAIVRAADMQVPPPFPVRWLIRRPDLRQYVSRTVSLDSDGAAALDLPLSDDLPTGQYTAEVALPAAGESRSAPFGSVSFQVEEFIPDRIRVAIALASDGTGDTARTSAAGVEPGGEPAPSARRLTAAADTIAVELRADYLFGRPADGLPASLKARLEPAVFAPDAWKGWTFGDDGEVLPGSARTPVGDLPAVPAGADEPSAEARLDDAGKAVWRIPLAAALPPPATAPATQTVQKTHFSRYGGPWRLSVAGTVRELGGRGVGAVRTWDVDAAPWYIAVRPGFAATARPGRPAQFDVALVAPDGALAAVDASLEARLFRETYNTTLVFRGGRYRYETERILEPCEGGDEAPATVSVSAGRGRIEMAFPHSGSYVLGLHAPGSDVLTSLTVHVSDGTWTGGNLDRRRPERLRMELLPAADTSSPATAPARDVARAGGPGGGPVFVAGGKARVAVHSPFAGTLLLTVETDEVLLTRVVEMSSPDCSAVIDIPAGAAPNAYVCASVVRAVRTGQPWRVHRACGVRRLTLDSSGAALATRIAAAGEARPGSRLPVEVTVADSAGAPVAGAAVALMAVDEGILQITGFDTPDPLAFFHGAIALAVNTADLFSELVPELAPPDRQQSPGGDAYETRRHRSPVSAKRVRPVAIVCPVVRTDSAGAARLDIDIPQFTGALRLMAVTYRGSQFGSAAASTLVRCPLLVQSSFPRFAAPLDRFEVTVSVFNNGTTAGQAGLTVELPGEGDSPNPLRFADDGREAMALGPLSLPPGGHGAVRFALRATEACGAGRVRLRAQLGGETFEETVELPVRPASPAVSRGGYAAVSVGEPLKLDVPGGMMRGTASLEARITPWPVLRLPEGLEYLDRYPWGCAEQTISGCLPLVYLSDIGVHIAPGMFESRRVADKLRVGILRLIGMQTADGGIAMWPGARDSWPWAGVYAAHLVVEASNAGHDVPDDFRARLLGYVRRLLDRGGDDGDMLELQAYACYVLALAGAPDHASMNRLAAMADSPPAPSLPAGAPQRTAAKAMLSLAHLAAGQRGRAVSLLPANPPPARSDRRLSGNLSSAVRDRALLISAMAAVCPEHPALPALVQQLADTREGRWLSTQDAAFAVMALGKYLRHAKAARAYETARVSPGAGRPQVVSEGGRAIVYRADEAIAAGGAQIDLSIDGPPGAVGHVSWLQQGVPLAPPPPADNGMRVRREYVDMNGNPINGELVSGQPVRVNIALEAPAGSRNIVIDDLLPAGLEIENPRLAGDGSAEQRHDARLVVARVDMRDDRLVLFGDMPAGGTAVYSYLARAVTPGQYAVPPVRAELMYDTGISSISGGGRLTVRPFGQGPPTGGGRVPLIGRTE